MVVDVGRAGNVFSREQLYDFLEELRRNPNIASVYGYMDYPYKLNDTITREYWLRISREELSQEKQWMAGVDGYAILHVHYAGKYRNPPDSSDRSTITHINIRIGLDSMLRPP